MLMSAIIALFLFLFAVEGCSHMAINNFKAVLGNPCAQSQLSQQLTIKYTGRLKCDGSTPSLAGKFSTVPSVQFEKVTDDSVFYTLFLLDGGRPDASISGMTFRIQWMVTGLTMSDLKDGQIHDINHAIAYERPQPAYDTKYLFVLFKEPADGIPIPEDRDRFNLKKYMEENNMCEYAAMFRFELKGLDTLRTTLRTDVLKDKHVEYAAMFRFEFKSVKKKAFRKLHGK